MFCRNAIRDETRVISRRWIIHSHQEEAADEVSLEWLDVHVQILVCILRFETSRHLNKYIQSLITFFRVHDQAACELCEDALEGGPIETRTIMHHSLWCGQLHNLLDEFVILLGDLSERVQEGNVRCNYLEDTLFSSELSFWTYLVKVLNRIFSRRCRACFWAASVVTCSNPEVVCLDFKRV